MHTHRQINTRSAEDLVARAQRGPAQVLFPNAQGERLSVHGVQYLLNKHRVTASPVPFVATQTSDCPPLEHTMAMDLLQAGVDRSVIALWLGHERLETTQILSRSDARHEGKSTRKSISAKRHAGAL